MLFFHPPMIDFVQPEVIKFAFHHAIVASRASTLFLTHQAIVAFTQLAKLFSHQITDA